MVQLVELRHATALQDVVCTLFKYTNLDIKAPGIAEVVNTQRTSFKSQTRVKAEWKRAR
jgi:hypothetical protein